MSRQLDLVVVNPGNSQRIYQSLSQNLTAIEPPVWAGLLSAFARNRGFSVEILDANAEQLSIEETADRVRDMNPMLTALTVYGHNPSASTQVMPGASALATELRQTAPDLKTIMVGGHVAALPERTMQEEDVDYVCSGEGLCTLVDLLETLNTGHPALKNVRGLLYREDGEVLSTLSAPLVRELDAEIPAMTWDLLPMHLYRAHNWHGFGERDRMPYAALYTSLGCPYRCSFCCIQAPFKQGEESLGYKPEVNSYRCWSPEAIIAQIDTLVNEYGVKNIKIADEMFVLNPRHVIGICDKIIERGYDLNIWAYTRVDTVQDRMIGKLREAGIKWLAIGIEAASEKVRNDVDKNFSADQIQETISRVRGADINIGANYIFGLPEDDGQSMQDTLDLALDINAEWANLYCAMAYPGSQLYETALRDNLPLPTSWAGYSQHAFDSLPLPTHHLPGEDVLRFRDAAFHTYFTHPQYLSMIQKKFGQDTVAHINEMTAQKLDRRYHQESLPLVG